MVVLEDNQLLLCKGNKGKEGMSSRFPPVMPQTAVEVPVQSSAAQEMQLRFSENSTHFLLK